MKEYSLEHKKTVVIIWFQCNFLAFTVQWMEMKISQNTFHKVKIQLKENSHLPSRLQRNGHILSDKADAEGCGFESRGRQYLFFS